MNATKLAAAQQEMRERHGAPVSGQEAAMAWNKWRESPDGERCAEGTATGEYLENRLWRAFMAGVKSTEPARTEEK